MAQTSLIIGDTNWAVKEDSLLGYNVIQNNYLPIPIDCVRATTATRVNEQGLIEIVPRNLFTSSEQIDTADWVKQGVSATANQAISPNGTLTAQLLDDGTAASTQHWIFQNPSLLNGATYTISFYAKYISRKFMAVNIFNGLASQYVYYNIQDGLVSGSTGDVTASITSVGNGWFRIVYTRSMATSGSAPNFRIGFADDTLNITYTGSNKQAYVWGFQLENFATVTEYFPTTNRLDIPRIDYSTGTASLLVEPQRTNVLLRSEEFDNASWAKSSVGSGLNPVVTANFAISPDGTQDADRIVFNTPLSTDISQITQTISLTGSSTGSVYLKAETSGDVGKVIAIRFNSAGYTLVTLTNNWQRFSVTATALSSFDIALRPAIGTSTGSVSVLAWGAQLEAGSYATSYIPTIASSVTRNADLISRTGISGLIGQTEGTMFVDVNLTHSNKGINEYLMQVWLDGSNRIIIYRNVSNFLCYFFVKPGGTFSFDSSISANGRHKIAFAYKNASNAFYIDGAQIEVNSSAVTAFSSLSNFDLGIHNASGSPIEIGDYAYKSAQLYKTRLTNDELQLLTTI
jgi:hypothetical protein